MKQMERQRLWQRRRKGVQKRLRLTTRPILTFYRSGKHIYAQISDPISGKTLTGASTRSPEIRAGLKSTKDVDAAKKVGAEIARLALSRDIDSVTFNRNGFLYTGRVKALADAAREAGLRF